MEPSPVKGENPTKIATCNENNPWSVEDVSVFLKYCCPECDYSNETLKIFTDHALSNHIKSTVLFQSENIDEDHFPKV